MKRESLITNTKGQGIIEFALVVPLLLFIVFGLIDLTRLIYHNSLLAEATREAARMASVGSPVVDIGNNTQYLLEPILGNAMVAVSNGKDDEGNDCTIIVLSPSNGPAVNVYITPKYTTSLAIGSILRTAIVFEMKYVTPVASTFGQKANIKALYFTRIETPPSP